MKNFAVIISVVLLSSCSIPNLEVIPKPNECRIVGFQTQIGDIITAEEGLEFEAEFVKKSLERYESNNNTLYLSVDSTLDVEEYVLDVNPSAIWITGGSPAGVFYGIQTLLQEAEAYSGKAFIGVVKDKPRYSWRGYMLDESRHFFGIDNALRTLDMMARYKMNRFHWHLTDAPGWRIEIKAFPELTTTGAIGCHTDPEAPARYYTREEIKQVVAYAAERHIEVVPEIDMPGHASSATRAYPALGVGKERGSFTYNPGKEEVYSFLTTVLGEVCELFPYEYLHIGGDEVFMGNGIWSEDPAIKNLVEREGYDDVKSAETYFLKRMAGVAHSLGKKLIAWDDILDLGNEGLVDAISWWRQERMDHVEQAKASRRELILCPRLPMYLDFVQDSTHVVGRVWKQTGQFCPIEDVYAFELGDSLVLGIQGNLWTELVGTEKRAEFMTYPRLCAIAEAAWTDKEQKDFASFSRRLIKEYALFDTLGIYYCDDRDFSRHLEPQF